MSYSLVMQQSHKDPQEQRKFSIYTDSKSSTLLRLEILGYKWLHYDLYLFLKLILRICNETFIQMEASDKCILTLNDLQNVMHFSRKDNSRPVLAFPPCPSLARCEKRSSKLSLNWVFTSPDTVLKETLFQVGLFLYSLIISYLSEVIWH